LHPKCKARHAFAIIFFHAFEKQSICGMVLYTLALAMMMPLLHPKVLIIIGMAMIMEAGYRTSNWRLPPQRDHFLQRAFLSPKTLMPALYCLDRAVNAGSKVRQKIKGCNQTGAQQ
jgi:hypothetical protein